MGGLGLLVLGVADSSFLFLPLGNDLLMLALTAGNPPKLIYFAGMASIGSMIGCLGIDWVSRKGGEQGLNRLMSPKRVAYVKRRVQTKAGWALALAALLPPPFPFTPFVAAAAALQYSRSSMFPILFCARLLRFCIIGLLAVNFGRAIQRYAESQIVQASMLGLLVICIVGTVASVWRWVQGSKGGK
jgi:membrane protein YqaA with SNARE-associated domain